MTVYDILGKEVATLVNENLSPGSYESDFNGSNLTSGVYFYRLETKEFTQVRKMIINK
ncbi:MAG: T9SS type A sorting domain-containing protein [Ignavibacteria bacterium]|nr:T9SS type A sorting domain-containing protein [Ignavibacteria bacterium]